jgi:dTMP kinase
MNPAPPVTTARTEPYRTDPMFVTFEGLDGSGKSTQVELLADAFRERGREVVTTREPGGTDVGEGIRQLVLHGPDMTPWTEAALYAAARAELVEEVIRPALERGAAVVCDRYIDSSIAYQGIGRGLGVGRVLELNLAAVRGLLPDRTFLIQIGPDEARSRQTDQPDRIERERDDFLAAVDEGYRGLAAIFPRRITAVDGIQPPEKIAKEIREHLDLS